MIEEDASITNVLFASQRRDHDVFGDRDLLDLVDKGSDLARNLRDEILFCRFQYRSKRVTIYQLHGDMCIAIAGSDGIKNLGDGDAVVSGKFKRFRLT